MFVGVLAGRVSVSRQSAARFIQLSLHYTHAILLQMGVNSIHQSVPIRHLNKKTA